MESIKKWVVEFLLKRYGVSVLKLAVTWVVSKAALAHITLNQAEVYAAVYALVQGGYHLLEKKFPQLDPLHVSTSVI